MTSFEHLYQTLFPQVAQDRITNYTFVRTIRPASSRNATQIDLVRPKTGPVTRHFGLDLCILKSIPVVHDDSVSQNRVLREVAVHRAITLGSNPIDERTLPLLSHFISYSIPGKDLKEANIKSRIGHPYLVLVLPYCKKGTLAQYFSQRFAPSTNLPKSDGVGTLSEKELRWTILEVIKALKRCHERGIVHRDIKAENVLLWDSSQAKGEKGLLRLVSGSFS
jgi:serine/threonine protein kinase